jgi:hypothetical protein
VPDRSQRGNDVFSVLHTGRIAVRANEDEITVHHRKALHAEPVGDELLLKRPRMCEDDIGIAAPADIKRGSRTQRHHFHSNTGLFLEDREQILE